jgi:hypothetical protein
MSLEIDEPFDIEVRELTLLVVPLEDGTFDVYKGESLFCNVFADIGIDTEPTWASSSLVDQELVDEIGYEIEMKEM